MTKIEKYDEENDRRQVVPGVIKPPLHGLTRIQKRFLLEPWFTTIWMVSWLASVTLMTLAILLSEGKLALLGALFFVVGGGAGAAKGFHHSMNVSSEGTIQPPPKNYWD